MSSGRLMPLMLYVLVTVVSGSPQPWKVNDVVPLDKRSHTETQTQTVTEATNTAPVTPDSLKFASSPVLADIVTNTGSCYSISGVGTFTTKKVYEFDSDSLPSDLQISSYLVYERKAGNPWNHGFVTSNVYVQDGYLNLVVPGNQSPARDSKKAIYGGEVYTAEQGILYGSVRTNAIFDRESGTCQGIFSYHDDNNEIDIEYLSNTSSTANPSPNKPPVLWYTNQPGTSSSQKTGGAPADVNSAINEYRIDWTPSWTKFYINGVLQRTLTGNVPQVGSQWVWNNWANGNADWSTGPPVNDNVFKIDSITMYYNTTNGGSC